MIDMYNEVDLLGYFIGSDRYSEYYDSNRLLHGGLGLLSKDGIFKPAAFAIEFLNRLYPYFIGRGASYLITGDNKNRFGIVCHNLKKLNYRYYLTNEEETDKDKMWKYFDDKDVLELNLSLTAVENGDYQIKIYRINENSGSILDIWKELDYYSELSREDIKYFRRVCEPKLQIRKGRAEKGMIDVKVKMIPNEIAFVNIEKII